MALVDLGPCAVEDCGLAARTRKADPRGLCLPHHRYLLRFGTPTPTLKQRLFALVDKDGPGGCWLWQGGTTNHGYGRFNNMSPHRLSYEFVNGPIPAGMEIDHICHVTRCVNPGHLRVTTVKQNRENRSCGWGETGIRGVRFHAGKWEVGFTHNRKYVYGGRFNSAELAAEAAKQLRLKLFTHNDLDRAC